MLAGLLTILFLRDVWVFHQHWLPRAWSWRSSLAGEFTGQRYRACEVDAHNRASTQGMSISKGIVLQDQQLDVNFVICQRREVFKRSVERLEIRRCTYVVTGLVSQENQWEWRLSRISEVIASAPDHFWLGSYFYFFGGRTSFTYHYEESAAVLDREASRVCMNWVSPVVSLWCWG